MHDDVEYWKHRALTAEMKLQAQKREHMERLIEKCTEKRRAISEVPASFDANGSEI